MHKRCKEDVKLYKRIKHIIDGNFLLSNDAAENQGMIDFIMKTQKGEEMEIKTL